MMMISKKVEKQINLFTEGTTFKYEQLDIVSGEHIATTKAIERLIKKGDIKRLSTGIFYRPKKTVFGDLKPSEEEILKPYLFKKGKRIAYITGISLYNQLGLTTQISKSFKIASLAKKISIYKGNIEATPAKSYIDVNDSNYYLLQLLDALKDFKKIPDLNKSSAIKILTKKIGDLSTNETKLLVKCCLAYPPRVRAFLGALLEKINTNYDLSKLKNSLNPLSKYDYEIDKTQLSTVENWNIK